MSGQLRFWVTVAIVMTVLTLASSLTPGNASPLGDDPQATIAAAEATQAAALATIAAVLGGEASAEIEDKGVEAPPPPLPVPVAGEGVIPFGSAEESMVLNPVWTWLAGEHPDSAYSLKLEPGALTLMAGDHTELLKEEDYVEGPRLTLPVSSDFEAQVMLLFEEGSGSQHACLGVRSPEEDGAILEMCRVGLSGGYDSYGEWQSWEGIRISDRKENETETEQLARTSYGSPELWLKIVRQESLVSFYYSDDGDEWNAIEEEYVFRLPSEVDVFLVVYSTDSEGFVTRFWDFSLKAPTTGDPDSQ